MRELKNVFMKKETSHHNYTYTDGVKIKKENDGFVYIYIDKYGILHVSKHEDIASCYGEGRYIKTDEVEAENGYPKLGENKYKVYGAGKDYVFTDKNGSKIYTNGEHAGKLSGKIEAYEFLRTIYVELDK